MADGEQHLGIIEALVQGIGKEDLRLTPGVVDDLYIKERGLVPKACAQGLYDGLFGREPSGIMRHGIAILRAVGLLFLGKKLLDESVALFLDCFSDPLDFQDIVADA
jgi:hypothetical protein